jgi:hypothetical protein
MFGTTGLSVAMTTSQGGPPLLLPMLGSVVVVIDVTAPVLVIASVVLLVTPLVVLLVASVGCEVWLSEPVPLPVLVPLSVTVAPEPELVPVADSETVDSVVGIVGTTVVEVVSLPSSVQPTCSRRAVRTKEEQPSELATLRIAKLRNARVCKNLATIQQPRPWRCEIFLRGAVLRCHGAASEV